MSKHTPGPWRTCAANDGRCSCGLIWSIPADVVVAELGSEEGSPAHTGDEGAANAALIAAAPDMLKLAEALVQSWEACADGAQAVRHNDGTIINVRALIARATGES